MLAFLELVKIILLSTLHPLENRVLSPIKLLVYLLCFSIMDEKIIYLSYGRTRAERGRQV
jgi:hypothetical protein